MNSKKDNNENIHVVVRCRPLNSAEKKAGAYNILTLIPDKQEIIIKECALPTAPVKSFVFDQVFGWNSEQIDLYKSVGVPILEDVLSGYNCTIFAYGPMGTGKTFTMEGERSRDASISWKDDPLSGIYQRTINQLFSRLETQCMKFSINVSFLEIFNEELIDLLGPDSIENHQLKIFEDTFKKGASIIQNITEVVVNNKDDMYQILQQGSIKRQRAAILRNTHSGHSHTLFTAKIYIKDYSVEGEELIRIGKFNLVDLAGRECIDRFGAQDKRANELGCLNKSLLTFGRVITALVDNAPHVPYCESKLTRLLQDSLGGKTKTSIIATISPASTNLHETLSTLENACKAKKITNHPEINKKLNKNTILKNYAEEIDRMKRDLQAAKNNIAVCISQENYNTHLTHGAQQDDTIREYEDRINYLVNEAYKINNLFSENRIKQEPDEKFDALTTTTHDLQLLSSTAESTFGLRDKIMDRLKAGEQSNEQKREQFIHNFLQNSKNLSKDVMEFTSTDLCIDFGEKLEVISDIRVSDQRPTIESLSEFSKNFSKGDIEDLTRCVDITIDDKLISNVDDFVEGIKKNATNKTELISDFLSKNRLILEFNIIKNLEERHAKDKELELLIKQQAKERADCTANFLNKLATSLEDSGMLIEQYFNERNIAYEALLKQSQATFVKQEIVEEADANLFEEVTRLLKTAGDKHENFLMMHEKITSGVYDLIIGESKRNEKDLLARITEFLLFEKDKLTRMSARHEEILEEKFESLHKDLESNMNVFLECATKTNASYIDPNDKKCCSENLKNFESCKPNPVNNQMEYASKNKVIVEKIGVSVHNMHETLLPKFDNKNNVLKEKIFDQNNLVADWSSSLDSDLSNRSRDIGQLWKAELRKDIPIVKTPQKKQFNYLKSWKKIGRRSLILEQFRAKCLLKEGQKLDFQSEDTSFLFTRELSKHKENISCDSLLGNGFHKSFQSGKENLNSKKKKVPTATLR